MPVYEYKCSECKTKFEVLHKSTADQKEVSCPECNSINNKKLFSAFSSNINSEAGSVSGDCSSGKCNVPSGGCSTGLCGLN